MTPEEMVRGQGQGGDVVEVMARAMEPELYADLRAVERDCPQFLPTYSGSALIAKARSKARAVITALSQQGLVIVPKEPTEAMIEAFYDAYNARPLGSRLSVSDTYRAMLSASPTTPDKEDV